MEEFKGTKKVYAVEYAGTIFMNEGPHYEDENVLNMSRVGDETAWANAKLYEAAPDLLEALQLVLEEVEWGQMSPTRRKVHKAITKALGK